MSVQPPAHSESCPRCNYKLGEPLKSSGRRVCVKCGWSDKPRSATATQATPSTDLTPTELQQLLNQAAADAIANMKPKRQQTPGNPGFKPPFPPFG